MALLLFRHAALASLRNCLTANPVIGMIAVMMVRGRAVTCGATCAGENRIMGGGWCIEW
jgi:hypothetical protein